VEEWGLLGADLSSLGVLGGEEKDSEEEEEKEDSLEDLSAPPPSLLSFSIFFSMSLTEGGERSVGGEGEVE